MSIKNYANLIKNKIDSEVLIKFDNNRKLDGVMRKKLNLSSKQLWMEIKNEFFKSIR